MKPLWLVSYLIPLAALACSGTADIPPSPDLQELLDSYERPTAVLDMSTVDATLESTPNLKELAAGVEAATYVMDEVDEASRTASTKSSSRIRLQGSVNLNIRCPGERKDPVYDENVNGSIALTLGIADTAIRRTFGGTAKACVLKGRLAGFELRIQLDGDMAFDVGHDIGLGTGWSGELLASLPGELRVDDYVFQSISGRITQGRFQNLVKMSDGKTVVLELSADGITVRDAVGVWFCAEGQPCAKQ
ncbi:MAG TPA: hypothetical protein VFK05_39790 [Polyangiaceae bacterium]|nr:hypothetical protein [Polyangiaceae bacterium]